MWYLIIPPLVFLGSLWLLLLFLSRRVADPKLQEKLADVGEEGEHRILFLKEDTGLRILEKINQRMKVFFLKLHNASGAFSQSLKARRERFREKEEAVRASETRVSTTPSTFKEEKKSFWMRFRGNGESGVAIGEAGERREHLSALSGELNDESSKFGKGEGHLDRQREHSGDSVQEHPSASSMIARRREVREKPKRLVSEEDLIGKIAKNPKDAVAYEELGDYYLETKQLEDAKACYRQVIKLLPMNRDVKEKVRKLERLLTQRGR